MSSPSVQPDLDQRTIRAATEYMTVIEEARALFDVVSESGQSYKVDLAEPACTCPDFEYRGGECKHIRRVRLEVGQVDVDEFTSQLESTARELETDAERLASEADELHSTSHAFLRTLERLHEVAD